MAITTDVITIVLQTGAGTKPRRSKGKIFPGEKAARIDTRWIEEHRRGNEAGQHGQIEHHLERIERGTTAAREPEDEAAPDGARAGDRQNGDDVLWHASSGFIVADVVDELGGDAQDEEAGEDFEEAET